MPLRVPVCTFLEHGALVFLSVLCVLGALAHKLGVHKLWSKQRASEDYEVFLSFRGVDTRKGFADYLYCSFVDAGICVFKDDDELSIGEKLSPDLCKTIKNSKILIPIISENYASSKWCLNGLVHMMECKKYSGHEVWPIFYKVEPEDVQDQMGSFGEAFHYVGGRHAQKVDEWKQALREVSSLQGCKIANGSEGEWVKLVVQEVLKKLKKAVGLVFSDYLVGIDSHVEEVMELVSSSATLYVGIYGMGGIGKTTLVKVIYNKLSDQFVHRSFITDIGESCNRNGINYLQNQLVFDMQKENIQFCNGDEGIKYISSRFKDKKVLIILDDVDTTNHLKALAGNHNWFGPGSRIFITTRHESVLDMVGVDIKYEHKQMDEKQSLILFSRIAFRKDYPPSELLDLSRLVVSLMGGLPLTIEVIGSFLCGKLPQIWRYSIEKMQNMPSKAVQEKLIISYDKLEEAHKCMLLDIACFSIGSDARVASYMWDACGFFARGGIEVLRSLSFINIGDNHELKMHDQIRDLGRKIVLAENHSKPHKRSRLWDYGEALEVLQRKKGSKKIEAICLEEGNSTIMADEGDSDYINDQGSRTFTDEEFRNLLSLRVLHMNDVNLIGDFKNIFSQLIWLKWGNCPPTFEAINFHPKELVILDLSGSLISDRWRGWSSMMMAEKLKVLNLTGCRSLVSTSYLSAFKRLEILIFRDCGKLEQIDPCIGDVETLISLDLSGCSHLKELPPQVGKLKLLKELLLDQTMIGEIPSSISSLKKLEMLSAKDCKFLLGLPDSIDRLVNLQCLSLERCHRLRGIPISIGMLKLLTRLDLSGCSSLEKLPSQVGELEQLKELIVNQTTIGEIPSSIGSLMKLEMFSAQNCELLLELPDSISCLVNLRCLSLKCCHGLRGIPESIKMLKLLTRLDLSGCSCLEELPPQMYGLDQLNELLIDQTMIQNIPSTFGSLKKLETVNAKDCKLLVGLPKSIGSLENLSTLVLSGCTELVALPDSIGSLSNLRCLSLGHCHQLREIPNSIGKLKLLTQLNLSGCSCLEKLPPPQKGGLELLKELFLDQTTIREIPSFISSLVKLKTLSAKDCELLVGLPDSIGSLVNLSTLVLSGCFKLAALPDSIGLLVNLRCLSLRHCSQVREIPSSIENLKMLTQLDLRGCSHLKELPPQIGELEQLKELILDQTRIQEIPSSIGSLTRLEKLSARYCVLLIGLPNSISCLVNLSTLVLSGCFKLAALPDNIGLLVNLRCLSLRHCSQVREIPSSIENLKMLTQLDLRGCLHLKELPPQIGELEQLKELILDQTRIQEIPSSIGSLTRLEKLSARYCILLVGLPDSIGSLVNLSTLVLSGCFKLAALPDSIGLLVNLRCLSLRHCSQVREIPSSIENLKMLTQLDLRGCSHLKELPPQIGELEQLKEFILDQTRIQEIPSSIGSLTRLEKLSARYCVLLVGLPNSIGCLVNLSTLVLSGCFELVSLPDSIKSLVNLRCLSLRRCHRLREIPNSIGKLKLLTQLDLIGCSCLEELLPQRGKLEQLKILPLHRTMIQEIFFSTGPLKKPKMLSAMDRKLFLIPDSSGLVDMQCMLWRSFQRELCNSSGMLQLLTRLNLTGRLRLVELPPLGELEQLEQLLVQTMIRKFAFSISSLRKIRNSFGMFEFLTQLNLSRCLGLEELPLQLGELKQLESFRLDETMIRNIPSSIGSLMKLKTLSAKNCKLLVGLPDSIGRLVSLLTLVLSGCVKLVALPDSIGFLVTLRCLSLGRCYQLREIPNSIGKLELLTQLDLSCMTIKELPESIGDLQNLEVLDISHSSIKNIPDGIGGLKELKVLK